MTNPFKVLHVSKKSKARVGEIVTAHGIVKTPAFMTIATRGAVKTLAAEDMNGLGAQIILSNTYHLFVRPGLEVIKKAGGLHKFMGWDGPILTDSGGYQVFSLAAKHKNIKTLKHESTPPPQSSPIKGEEVHHGSPPLVGGVRGGDDADYDVRITRDGAEFIDRKSGRKDMFTPERVLEIQRDFGVDIAMVLDVCAPYPVSKEGAREAMELTTEWAKRSRQFVISTKRPKGARGEISHTTTKHGVRSLDGVQPRTELRSGAWARDDGWGGLVFGIIQGSVYKDLRQQSAREITALDFNGYAIGGVAVGETARQKRQVVDWVVPHLPEDKPRYLMGLGQPEEIVHAVRAGIDMFDCVLPTRNARHGNLYVRNPKFVISTKRPEGAHGEISHATHKQGVRSLDGVQPRTELRSGAWARDDGRGNFYQTLHITNEKYRADFKPPDPSCDCFTCTHHSRAYLRHLFKVGEPLALRLATIHNVKFYLDLIESLRMQIVQGAL